MLPDLNSRPDVRTLELHLTSLLRRSVMSRSKPLLRLWAIWITLLFTTTLLHVLWPLDRETSGTDHRWFIGRHPCRWSLLWYRFTRIWVSVYKKQKKIFKKYWKNYNVVWWESKYTINSPRSAYLIHDIAFFSCHEKSTRWIMVVLLCMSSISLGCTTHTPFTWCDCGDNSTKQGCHTEGNVSTSPTHMHVKAIDMLLERIASRVDLHRVKCISGTAQVRKLHHPFLNLPATDACYDVVFRLISRVATRLSLVVQICWYTPFASQPSEPITWPTSARTDLDNAQCTQLLWYVDRCSSTGPRMDGGRRAWDGT